MKQVDQHALFALGILDMMEDGAFIFSPESLRFSYVNQGAAQQTGYSREELLGMTPLSLKLEFNEPQFRQMLEPLLRGEAKTVRFTTTHRRKNGHDILVEVIFHYLVSGNEAPSLVANRTRRHGSQGG